MVLNCRGCGAGIVGRRSDAVWCSDRCRMRTKRGRGSDLNPVRPLFGLSVPPVNPTIENEAGCGGTSWGILERAAVRRYERERKARWRARQSLRRLTA